MRDCADMNLPCVNLPLIHELADGGLDLPATRRLNEHMIECASCSDEYAFVTDLRDTARDLPRMVPGDHVWESIAAAISTGACTGDADGGGDGLDEPAAANISLVAPPRRFWTVGRAVAAGVPLLAAGAIAASMLHDGVGPRRLATAQQNVAATTVHEAATDPVSVTRREEKSTPSTTEPSPRTHTATRSPASADPGMTSTANTIVTVAENAPSHSRALPAEFLMQYGGHDLLAQPGQRSSEVDRELLAEAEAAIRRCTVALQDNPDDPRIRAALTRAYQQKVSALRSLMASSDGYAARPRGNVTLEPASAEVPALTGTGP